MREMSDVALVDTRELLLYVMVGRDGVANMGGSTKDWEWVAKSLRALADRADAKAAAVLPKEG